MAVTNNITVIKIYLAITKIADYLFTMTIKLQLHIILNFIMMRIKKFY